MTCSDSSMPLGLGLVTFFLGGVGDAGRFELTTKCFWLQSGLVTWLLVTKRLKPYTIQHHLPPKPMYTEEGRNRTIQIQSQSALATCKDCERHCGLFGLLRSGKRPVH